MSKSGKTTQSSRATHQSVSVSSTVILTVLAVPLLKPLTLRALRGGLPSVVACPPWWPSVPLPLSHSPRSRSLSLSPSTPILTCSTPCSANEDPKFGNIESVLWFLHHYQELGVWLSNFQLLRRDMTEHGHPAASPASDHPLRSYREGEQDHLLTWILGRRPYRYH